MGDLVEHPLDLMNGGVRLIDQGLNWPVPLRGAEALIFENAAKSYVEGLALDASPSTKAAAAQVIVEELTDFYQYATSLGQSIQFVELGGEGIRAIADLTARNIADRLDELGLDLDPIETNRISDNLVDADPDDEENLGDQILGHHAPQCFPADTPILTSLTQTTPIADLRVGDMVLAFDPEADLGRGALMPRRVTRLYSNTTREWLLLRWREGGEERELVATPGHSMLTRQDRFAKLGDLVRDGRVELVLANGAFAQATVGRIRHTADAAHLFEPAQAFGMIAGNAALQPAPLEAWQTYNIKMEDLRTHVAGWVRERNKSGAPRENSAAAASASSTRQNQLLGPSHATRGAHALAA